MRIKVLAVATMAVALLGLGMLVGGIMGTSGAFAQTPTAKATPAPDKSGAPRPTVTAKLTKEQAEQAALAASPGNTIDHSRLGKDADGTIFWDVDFTNDGGVLVNAQTGAVIKVEAAGTDVHGPRGGGKPGASGTPTP